MFAARNLSVLAYAQGFTLWHYRADSAVAEACAPDYFAEASDLLARGDMMLVSARDGGRVLFATPEPGGLRMRSLS
jgi:predicted lipoprotein with Yx(FWY)xxD motif